MKLLKALRPGVLAYRFYYAPKAWIRDMRRQGAANKFRVWRGMKAMEAAAWKLPVLPASASAEAATAPEVTFLTGDRFWYQSAFCMQSMIAQAGRPYRPVFYDDGTLTAEQRGALLRIFPKGRVVTRIEAEERLFKALPRERYPALHAQRDSLPLMRKLMDIHAGQQGWRLFLDSDMLFFRRPDFLMNWLARPDRFIHMVDAALSYGHPVEFLEKIGGARVPQPVNTGITGMKSDLIDWDRMEGWMRAMLERAGSHYLQEQALTALIFSQIGSWEAVPAADYLVLPKGQEGARPTAVLHHYVADSKIIYFDITWKMVAGRN
jgi:hypothetical protein